MCNLGHNLDGDRNARELALSVVQAQLDLHGDLRVALLDGEQKVVDGVLVLAQGTTASVQGGASCRDIFSQRIVDPQTQYASLHLRGELFDVAGYQARRI